VQRAAAFPGYRIHLASPWLDAQVHGDRIRADTKNGSYLFDFAIAGTGFQYDPRTRAELRDIADDVALRRDVYVPPPDLADDDLGTWPYLGPGYEFTERAPGRAPWLKRIRVFSAAAGSSFGLPVGDVASLATGIPRLVDAIGRDLFFEYRDLPVPAQPPEPSRPSFREFYEHAVRAAQADMTLTGVGAG
jgi:hypothetical protein